MSASVQAARLLAFALITLGHCVLVTACLRRFNRSRLRDFDEYAYFAVLFAFGSTQSVLHLLALTVGIGYWSGLAAFGAIDAILAVWLLRTRRCSAGMPPRGGHGALALGDLPRLVIPGVVAVVALSLQWYSVTAVSLRVAGTDAAHYHVPHAVNFAHGANLFGFVATPHLYPMGTSIWAAWLLQPLPGPALLDLTTFPSTLLLLVSIGLLFRAAIGESGVLWAPWLTLWILSAPLVRLSLLPSADMFYTAAFLAVFVQCFIIWRSRTVRSMDLWGFGVASGLLLSTKTTGFPSLLLILAVWAAVLLLNRVADPKQHLAWRVGWLSLAGAFTTMLLAGGIWLVRNWVVFGSPMAPSGLTLLGVPIFPGDAYLEGGYYNSVLRDMRDFEEYSPASRFVVYAKRLIGPWFAPASLAVLIFCADAAIDWWQSWRPSNPTISKLTLFGTTAALAIGHAVLLVPAPWTSLEWTRGLALRYVLPLIILWLTVLALCVFPAALAQWHRHPPVRWAIGIIVAAAVVVHYTRHSNIPGLPQAEWFPVFDVGMVALSAAVVLFFLAPSSLRTYGRALGAVLLTGTVVLISYRTAERNDRLLAASGDPRQWRADTGPDTDYRCVYRRVLESEQQRPGRGARRFFVASRFDRPLDLQGPQLENLVYDVRGRTELAELLKTRGPGTGSHDYIVIDRREHDGWRSARLAFAMAATSGLQLMGNCGRYDVYRPGSRSPDLQ